MWHTTMEPVAWWVCARPFWPKSSSGAIVMMKVCVAFVFAPAAFACYAFISCVCTLCSYQLHLHAVLLPAAFACNTYTAASFVVFASMTYMIISVGNSYIQCCICNSLLSMQTSKYLRYVGMPSLFDNCLCSSCSFNLLHVLSSSFLCRNQ